MEVSWQTQVAHYQSTAQRSLAALTRATPSDYLLDRILDLLRTYTRMPRWQNQPLAADEAIVHLASTAYLYVQPRGRWSEILALWPALHAIAAPLSAPDLPALLLLQQAIVYQNLGRAGDAQTLYEQLLHHPALDQMALALQTEILHQASVCYLTRGQYTVAEQILLRGLEISAAHRSAVAQPQTQDARGTRTTPLAPVWETRAYLLNLLGNLAWYRGQHATAARRYGEGLALFLENGEADNLACVVYQGLGRLYLVEGRYAEALPLLQRNYNIRCRREERGGVAHAAIYLAGVRMGCGDLAGAEALLNESLLISQNLEDRTGQAICHFYYGEWEARRGNMDAAITQWEHALHLFDSAPAPYEERQTLAALSLQYLRRGRCHESHRTFATLLQNLANTQPLPHGAA